MIAVLLAAGVACAQAVDPTLSSVAGCPAYDQGFSGYCPAVGALAVQADGKIVIGGAFTVVGNFLRTNLARLNADGSVDRSFNQSADFLGIPQNFVAVLALAVQADGKILVGGSFNTLGAGTGPGYLGRLNADGSVDTTFKPGAINNVNALAIQGNGQILVGGGDFNNFGIFSNLVRLNADGSVDTTFNPGVGQDSSYPGYVSALSVQANGQILVGGGFDLLGGGGYGTTTRDNIGRLNADGSLDTSFNPSTTSINSGGSVNRVVVQANGQILVGGIFAMLGGSSRSDIGRLNADGSLDTSFNPGAGGSVSALAVQADGKILIGGSFPTLGGGGNGTTARSNIGRLNADGSLDPSFNPGVAGGYPSPYVYSLAVQGDGRILVGGTFAMIGGAGTGPLGRLLNTTPPVDFNEDGLGDAFLQNAVGNWAVEDSVSGGGFTTAGSGTWTPGWSVTPAHFSGSGLTDLFLFNNTTGQWFRMLNNRSGGFSVQSTAAWGTNWQRYVVDLNGDGISDVFLWDPSLGQWFECLSDGTGNFTYTQGFWEPGLEVYPMHFTTSGRQDFFLFNRSTGQWFWAEGAPGGGFTYPQSAFWSPGWTFYPGDFNGDGLTDLLLVNPSTGFWFVAMTGANGFTYTSGFFAPGFNIYPMDLQGVGRTDLFLHNPTTGQWFEMISDGAGGFTNEGGAAWTLGWQLYPTNFTGDGAQDLLLYNPTTGVWFQAINQYPDGSPAVFSYVGGVWSPGLTLVASRPYFGG